MFKKIIKNIVKMRNKLIVILKNKVLKNKYIKNLIEIIMKVYEWKKNWIINIIIILLLVYILFYINKDMILIEILIRRLIILIEIVISIIIYKKIMLNLIKKKEKIKEIFMKNKKINLVGLIIIKWINIIYNDILIIIIKIMIKIRKRVLKNVKDFSYINIKIFTSYKDLNELFNRWKNEKYGLYLWCKFDKLIYIIFFIIIKDIIITIVELLRKIKKNIIEENLIEIIKKRVIIWALVTIYILKGFWINFLIIYIYIVLKSLNKSINKIYKDIMGEEYTTWKLFRWKSENWKITEQPRLYDKLIEGIYILRYCKIEEDLDIWKFRWIATSKIVDIENNKYLKIYNNEIYWYQPELYYVEKEDEIKIELILRFLYWLKINIISLLRIKKIMKAEKNEERKEEIKKIEKKYEENLELFGKIWKSVLKEEGNRNSMGYLIKLNWYEITYKEGSHREIYEMFYVREDEVNREAILKISLDIKTVDSSEKIYLNSVKSWDRLTEKKEEIINYYKNLKKIKKREKELGIEENINNVFEVKIWSTKEEEEYFKNEFGVKNFDEWMALRDRLEKENPEKEDEIFDKYVVPYYEKENENNSKYMETKKIMEEKVKIKGLDYCHIFYERLVDSYMLDLIGENLIKNLLKKNKKLPEKLRKGLGNLIKK